MKKKLTPFPADDRTNPYAGINFDAHPYKQAVLSKTFKGHMVNKFFSKKRNIRN